MRQTFASSILPIRIVLQCFIIVLSTWAKHGFATSDNLIQFKNKLFMHRPIFIEELFETNQVRTSERTYSRQNIEAGEIPIEIIKAPRFAPQELNRVTQNLIEEKEDNQGLMLSQADKNVIRKNIFRQYANRVDSQVIEGLAMAVTNGSAEKILSLFLKMDNFSRYAPDLFLECHHLTQEELDLKRVYKPDNVEFQYSRVRIASVEFSHTLKYELSSELKSFNMLGPEGIEPIKLKTYTVAWEIDPKFKRDPIYGQKGVLMNNGQFFIEPYVDGNNLVDPSKSVIVYQVYIKVHPLNAMMDRFKDFFVESEAKSALRSLATALRKRAVY